MGISIRTVFLSALGLALLPLAALAQNVVKIGQIEAQTGPAAIYGWMGAMGVRLAVNEINAAGGFTVAGKQYKFELIQPDTQGNPQQGLLHAKKLLEQDQVKYLLGPSLTNVFRGVQEYVKDYNGKILWFAPATAAYLELGKPGFDQMLLRPVLWDTAPLGFGTTLIDLLKKKGVKKVAFLLQNDSGAQVLLDIYREPMKKAGIELQEHLFEPNTKDYSAVLSRIAAWKPDYLAPGYTDGVLFDIVQQATQLGLTKFWLVRGTLGPGLRNKDQLDEYIAYVPKYFEEAIKTEPKAAKFMDDWKRFFKTSDFPWDQAAQCYAACYDMPFMLVEAFKRAGSVDDVQKVRREMQNMVYKGLFTQSFDEKGSGIHSYSIVELRRGGKTIVHNVEPPAK